MRKITKLTIVLIIIVAYFLIINFYSTLPPIYFGANQTVVTKTTTGGFIEKLGLGDSVTVQVEKKRFYGKILEQSSNGNKNSQLYLFNIFKLPIIVNDLNLKYLHITFAVTMLIVILIILFQKERRYLE